jgi:Tektin family
MCLSCVKDAFCCVKSELESVRAFVVVNNKVSRESVIENKLFSSLSNEDNVDDEVERHLRKERAAILSSLAALEKFLRETIEQIRKLRASIYLLDRDLANKETSLQIDQQNLTLRENQIDMKIYEGTMNLDPL